MRKHPFESGAMSKRIPLTQGKYAIVDDEDYEWLSRHKWYAIRKGNVYYAARMPKGKGRKHIYMHREILGAPNNKQVDHINHYALDNCKSNLRLCTNQENRFNSKSDKNGSSKYKGVSWYRPLRKWGAQICYNGKRIYLGYFHDEISAAKAYDESATELFGKFARLNNIGGNNAKKTQAQENQGTRGGQLSR